MKVNHSWQGRLVTNNLHRSQFEPVCLHIHVLGYWSTTIEAVRIQIKIYRLLFIFLHFRESVSLRTDRAVWNSTQKWSITGFISAISFSPSKSFVTFRAMDNWCCHYGHYVNVCSKDTRGNEHVSRYFQLQRLWSTKTPNFKLYLIRISTWHFKILKKQTCNHIQC